MKVRNGTIYEYNANGFDQFDAKTDLEDGELCVVKNQYGCPPANTMGCCHVTDLEGHFLGLVSCISLTRTEKAKKAKKRA